MPHKLQNPMGSCSYQPRSYIHAQAELKPSAALRAEPPWWVRTEAMPSNTSFARPARRRRPCQVTPRRWPSLHRSRTSSLLCFLLSGHHERSGFVGRQLGNINSP